MKRPACLALLLMACTPGHRLPPELRDAGVDPAPTVITGAAVVLFWLPSVDSLSADSTAMAAGLLSQVVDDFRDLLSDTDVDLLVTTRTRIYVDARDSGGPRRIVSLAGLDYPWGVVFVEPGYAEQILTGPMVPSDLRELAVDYFGLDTDDERSPIAENSKGRLPIAHCPMKRWCSFSIAMPTSTTSQMGNGQWAIVR